MKLFVFAMLCAATVWGQTTPNPPSLTAVGSILPTYDTLVEAQVVGFLEAKSNKMVAAPIGVIDRRLLQNTDQTSLQTALNTIPGVMMESRGAGGSHRISIRGSALRAPFAVRNVKMYVNGIAFTSPDGQSPLELMDASDFASIEVLRGPSGALWGSGNGGVMHFNLLQPKGQSVKGFKWRSEAQAGSFDQYRINNSIQVWQNRLAVRFSQTNQSVSGYRDQEFNRKSNSILHIRSPFKDNHMLEVLGMYYNGNWGLPGGLTNVQRDEDRTAAIPFSIDSNASVWRDRKMIGVSHSYSGWQRWTIRNTMNGYSTQKTNPYGTSGFRNGFKKEFAAGGGLRSEWTRRFDWKSFRGNRLTFGGETQMEHYFIDERKNDLGKPGDFKYMYNVNYSNVNAFAMTDLVWKDRLQMQLGGSVIQEFQQVSGYTNSNWTTDTMHRSDFIVLPRTAISWRWGHYWNAFASYGWGSSMPTIFEMVDYENNQYNLKLKPEQGLNKEVGVKFSNPTRERSFEINAYYTNIRRIILSETQMVQDPGNPTQLIEVDKYANKGSTVQKGLEWSGKWTSKMAGGQLELFGQTSGSWNMYRFLDFVVSDRNYASRRLPGVPSVQWFNRIQLEYKQRMALGAMAQYMGPIDLNYSNTVRSSDYTVLNVYAHVEQPLGQYFTLGLRGGLNNVTDVKYSGYYNYNDFNGRYYNPALPKNWFALIMLQFEWIKP